MDLKTFVADLEASSVYRPVPIDREPVTCLYRWQVYEVSSSLWADTTRHFVGWTGTEGRVSSAMRSYNSETKEGISESGRVYKLVGESAYNPDAEYVWAKWASFNKLINTYNVTTEYE